MGTSKGYANHRQYLPIRSKDSQHNILITNETPARACLADFGLSTLTPSAPGETTTITTGGTPLYMAPELLNPEKFGKTNSRPTQPADVYAFGMVIYEVLTGFDPFYEQRLGTIQLVCRVLDGARPTKPGNAEEVGFGSGTWELVNKCWKTKSARRPTIERVLAHLARVSGSSAVPADDSLEFDSPSMLLVAFSNTRQSSHCERSIATVSTHNGSYPRPWSPDPPRSGDHPLTVATSGLARPEIPRLCRPPQDARRYRRQQERRLEIHRQRCRNCDRYNGQGELLRRN